MKKIRTIEAETRNIPESFLKKLGAHISQVGGLYVHTPTQLKKKSKTYLVKQVLRLEKLIVIITYNAYKMQLPRLRTIRRKALPKRKTLPKLKKYEMPIAGLPKRKFSRKQLAAQRLFAKRARAGTLRKRRRR